MIAPFSHSSWAKKFEWLNKMHANTNHDIISIDTTQVKAPDLEKISAYHAVVQKGRTLLMQHQFGCLCVGASYAPFQSCIVTGYCTPQDC